MNGENSGAHGLIDTGGKDHHPWASRDYEDGVRCSRSDCVHYSEGPLPNQGQCGNMSFCDIGKDGCKGFTPKNRPNSKDSE